MERRETNVERGGLLQPQLVLTIASFEMVVKINLTLNPAQEANLNPEVMSLTASVHEGGGVAYEDMRALRTFVFGSCVLVSFMILFFFVLYLLTI